MSIVEVNRFKVAGEDERIYTIVEYQEVNEAKHSGGTEMLPGRKTWKTTDGQRVNRIDEKEGIHQLVQTGIKLQKL